MTKSFLQILSLCLLLQIAACSPLKNGHGSGPAKAEWPVKQIDLGEIPQGIPVTREFMVKNIGGKSLSIREAKVTCHCMTADWTKTPIRPGKSGWVRVTYNAEQTSEFYRLVPVSTSADSIGRGTVLILKGKVLPKPEPKN